MENASKALIIAGAILLSILIVSLGIMVFNNVSGIASDSSLDDVQIATFNDKFEKNMGANVRGTNVNTLLQTISTNNISNQDDPSMQVSVTVNASNWQTGDKPSGVIKGNYTKALTGKTYKVESTIDEKTGLITLITISDAN